MKGFTFLNIPRSYYKILTRDMLVIVNNLQQDSTEGMLSAKCADVIYDICVSEGLLHDDCSLVLDISKDAIKTIIESKIPAMHQEEYSHSRDDVVKTILHSRYANL